jgi:hypothetical protein
MDAADAKAPKASEKKEKLEREWLLWCLSASTTLMEIYPASIKSVDMVCLSEFLHVIEAWPSKSEDMQQEAIELGAQMSALIHSE